jgi:hypothetical protein
MSYRPSSEAHVTLNGFRHKLHCYVIVNAHVAPSADLQPFTVTFIITVAFELY